MRRLAATITFVLAFALPAIACAAPMSATQILEKRAELDGRQVTLSGEAIGEALNADEGHVWVNVLSEGTALGVYLPAEMAGSLSVFGDYKHKGDIVLVTGELRQACDQHGGDMDIHAASMEVIQPGEVVERPIQTWKFGLAAFGLVLVSATTLYARHRRRVVEGA